MSTNQLPANPRAALLKKILLGAVFVCLVFQVFMVLRFEINQDEFYNLNMGYEFLRGEVGNPFQTLMFRFTGLLGHVPGNEIDQIVFGRIFTYVAGTTTCLLIYLTSRRYFSVHASLFAVLAFLSFNYVFRHLTAFRTDILVTMNLMAILWLVSDPKQSLRKVITTGVLIGTAFTLALKSIFYMPIVAIFLVGRWIISGWSRQAFLHGLIMFFIAVLTYIAIFVLHDPATYSSGENAGYLKTISGTSIIGGGLFNRWGILVISLVNNPVGWALIFFGFTELRAELKGTKGERRLEKIALLSFIIPLTPTVFYYHANAYFYPFMLAPAVIFIAAAADRLLIKKRPLLFFVIICIFCILPSSIFIRSMSQNQDIQRATVEAVHDIFPQPVPIIDYCGMISSFDRVNEVGLFINPDIFAHSRYTDRGKPIMAEHLKTYQPQILLANVTGLDLENEYEHQHKYPMLDQDTEVLKNNYLKFWGPIYVPGKTIDQNGPLEILIDGTYTYYGPTGVRIDGIELTDGQAVHLDQGEHEVSSIIGSAKLVWGDNLKKPDIPESNERLFNGF